MLLDTRSRVAEANEAVGQRRAKEQEAMEDFRRSKAARDTFSQGRSPPVKDCWFFFCRRVCQVRVMYQCDGVNTFLCVFGAQELSVSSFLARPWHRESARLFGISPEGLRLSIFPSEVGQDVRPGSSEGDASGPFDWPYRDSALLGSSRRESRTPRSWVWQGGTCRPRPVGVETSQYSIF